VFSYPVSIYTTGYDQALGIDRGLGRYEAFFGRFPCNWEWDSDWTRYLPSLTVISMRL